MSFPSSPDSGETTLGEDVVNIPSSEILRRYAECGLTGEFQFVRSEYAGSVFIKDGRFVHAVTGNLIGDEAMREMQGYFIWRSNTNEMIAI